LKITDLEILRNDYRATEVFTKQSIDFCCGGKKSIATTCAEKGLGTEGVLSALEHALADKKQADHSFDDMPLT
jgi:regulator of cell morphogenesis and NO signaling